MTICVLQLIQTLYSFSDCSLCCTNNLSTTHDFVCPQHLYTRILLIDGIRHNVITVSDVFVILQRF